MEIRRRAWCRSFLDVRAGTNSTMDQSLQRAKHRVEPGRFVLEHALQIRTGRPNENNDDCEQKAGLKYAGSVHGV